jgi:hypothetical protein
MIKSEQLTEIARADSGILPWWQWLTSIGWRTWVLIYLTLPVAMFAATWIRPVVGIPVLIVLVLSIVFQAKRERLDSTRIFHSAAETLLLLGAAMVWVGLSGAGGFGAQNVDYIKHTKILRDLVAESWPVVYETGGATGTLVYYFAWYLPPAAIGKLFGWPAAQTAQYWWSVLGVFLTLAYVTSVVRGRWSAWFAITLFTLLSGMDAVAQLTVGPLPSGTAHIETFDSGRLLQYSSNTTALFWVPHQAIFAWLASAFILSSIPNQRVGSVFFVAALGALWSPFCMLGLLPVILALLLTVPWRKFLTFENLAGASVTLLILVPFIASNRFDIPRGPLWQMVNVFDVWPGIVVFYLTEFVVLVWFLGRPQQIGEFRAVWWSAIISLALFPLYQVGQFSDLTMRASLPALFILWIYVLEKLASRPWNFPHFKPVYFILILGAFTPVYEISRSLKHWRRSIPRMGQLRVAEWEIPQVKNQYLSVPQSAFSRLLQRESRHAILRVPAALDRGADEVFPPPTSLGVPNPNAELTEISETALVYTEWTWDKGWIAFYADGLLVSTWGEGLWSVTGSNQVVVQFLALGSTHRLTFNVDEKSYEATSDRTGEKNRGVLLAVKPKPPGK